MEAVVRKTYGPSSEQAAMLTPAVDRTHDLNEISAAADHPGGHAHAKVVVTLPDDAGPYPPSTT